MFIAGISHPKEKANKKKKTGKKQTKNHQRKQPKTHQPPRSLVLFSSLSARSGRVVVLPSVSERATQAGTGTSKSRGAFAWNFCEMPEVLGPFLPMAFVFSPSAHTVGAVGTFPCPSVVLCVRLRPPLRADPAPGATGENFGIDCNLAFASLGLVYFLWFFFYHLEVWITGFWSCSVGTDLLVN